MSASAAGTSMAKSACRSPVTTSVPVMRAMCAWSAYVGSNSSRTPARAAVGEQQRLQHLVAAVGAEDAFDRLAEERTERAAQLGRGAIGIAVPVDRRAARRASASTNASGGAYGLSLVLSRTGTSTCGEWYPSSARRSSRGRMRSLTAAVVPRLRATGPHRRARSSPSLSASVRTNGATRSQRAVVERHDVHVLLEVGDAQRAREARGAAGGQHVVDAGDVVADHRGRVGTDEHRARVADERDEQRRRPRT